MAQTTTNTKFDEKWTELQPTLNTTVENLVNTNLETFKSTLWQEVTKNESFPFLLPENFGAVGDGTTDDSTAFNACFAEAMEKHKCVLLSTKAYFIGTILYDINSINILGLDSAILVKNTSLFVAVDNCYFNSVYFIGGEKTLIQNTKSTLYEKCVFQKIKYLFGTVNLDEHDSGSVNTLLNNCKLYDSGLCKSMLSNIATHVINSTLFFISGIFIDDENIGILMSGGHGEKYIYNNCTFYINTTVQSSLFNSNCSLIFNNCNIEGTNLTPIFRVLNYSKGCNYIFNNCTIKNTKSNLITLAGDFDSTYYLNVKIINSNINVKSIFNSPIECSLWLENNSMETKPIINEGTGKINISEIQQKYSANSSNVFPWISEIPSTYENNVKLIKTNDTEYYVLTENRYTNVKKLDYYFNYNLNYLPSAPYYNNTITFGSLGLMGLTVKKALLNNELCKLKNDNGELIDYVYMMLDECTVDTTETTLGENTTIAMKFLPYFAKLKTDTAVAGQCDVNMCISIILEKTS